MKMNKIIFSSFFIAVCIIFSTIDVFTNSNQPDLGRTNAPGEQSCASSTCHSGAGNPISNAGIGFNFNGNNQSYVPGNSYTVIISSISGNGSRFGFEATALTMPSQNNAAGTFTVTNAINTATRSQGGRNYIHHLSANGNNSWSFTWNAPASNVGDVVFYVALNAANGNMNSLGDIIYVDTFIIRAPVALPPVADFNANITTVCTGQTLTFTDASSNDVTSWNWNFGSGANPSTANTKGPHTITYSTAGTKTVSLTVNAPGGSDTKTKANYITVNALPLADAGNNVSVCKGNSTQLNATGGTSYTWSPSQGLSQTNIANPVASPTVTTTYTVTVTSNNCSATDFVTVTVNNLPVVNFSVNTNTICIGESVTFTNNTNNSISCLWDFKDGNTSNSCSQVTHTFTQAGSYFVRLSVSDNNCTQFAEELITVHPLPNANAGNDVSICNGGSVQLTATGGTSYLWSTGETTQSIIQSPLNDSSYIVTVTYNGCTAADTVNVFVSNSLSVSVGNDTTICIGNAVQLFSSGGVFYSWTPANGLNNPGISNPIASPNDTTQYKVVISDGACFDSAFVTVNVVPNAVNAMASGDTSICQGSSVQLSVSGGSFYSWTPSSGLNFINVPNPVATPTQTTIYIVTVSDGICTDTDTVNVGVTPSLQTGITNDTTVIINSGSFTLQLIASGGSSYLWSPSAGVSNQNIPNPVFNPFSIPVNTDTTLIYSVSISNGACTVTETVSITLDFIVGIPLKPDLYSEVKLFPNPASSSLNISVPDNLAMQLIEVYDLTGNLKTKYVYPENQNSIDISSLTNGSYLFRFIFNDQAIYKMIQIRQ
jgi:PKD repeat protein